MKSIQTKFILLILGCILLSVSVIGGAGIVNFGRAIDKDSATIMNLICGEKSAEINSLLSRTEQSVDTLAFYTKNEFDLAQFKTDTSYIDTFSKRMENVALKISSSTEGAVAVYMRFNPEKSNPTSGFFWRRDRSGGEFKPITPTDFSMYKPTDLEHVGWYYIPVKKAKPTWLAPYVNKNINVNMISYVVPIIVDGEAVGVIGMDIDFDIVTKNVDNMHIYENGYVFLVDNYGHIMYHRTLPFNASIFDVEELAPLQGTLAYGSSNDSLVAYTWEGQQKKLAFRSLINGMRLIATAPTEEIDNGKTTLIYHVLLSAVVILLLAAFLTITTSRRIVKPLRELTVAAQKIADGDLSVSITHKTNDEVGVLATSFQKTVEHLKKHLDYINSLAYTDTLTGARSKAAYQEAVKTLNQDIIFGQTRFAVVFLDINNLKYVNDTYGHDFGDMLILASCNLIRQTFKDSSVYRIGGDEFVVILENDALQNAQALLIQLQKNIENHNKNLHAEYTGYIVSIALGIAFYKPETDFSFDSVFKRADDAMYQNKASIKKALAENNP